MSSSTSKKQLTWRSSLKCHADLVLHFPSIITALVNLDAAEIDAIGTAISDVNDCNLSSVRHNVMNKLLPVESNSRRFALFKIFGKEFARFDNGDVPATQILLQEISATKSPRSAKTTLAVAHFQAWENLVANTIMATLNGALRGHRREEQNLAFEIVNLIYFFPLYVWLAFNYTLLNLVPSSVKSTFLYKKIYLFVSLIQFSVTLPVGLICIILKKFIESSPPLGSRSEYVPIADEAPTNKILEINKPSKEDKVGLRFGADRNGNLTVSNVKSGSLAALAGLQIGDMVKSINGENVESYSPKAAAEMMLDATGVVKVEVAHSDDNSVEFDEKTV